jgi:pyruvate,water dikinase
LRRELTEAYTQLGARCSTAQPRVAVRSSAVDEDGQETSFAGQHASYLNVIGVKAVIAAAGRCLASVQSDRALAYRRAHGLPREARVAVLVQQLVRSDVSAVVFSADPRTDAREQIVLNATWGLGESLVGGTVTPDLYLVRKTDLAILSRQIADKAVMTVLWAEGTREIAVPRMMRQEPVLDDVQVQSLASLARSLEEHEGWPVDLECAYARDQLYLLQCRPITAGIPWTKTCLSAAQRTRDSAGRKPPARRPARG